MRFIATLLALAVRLATVHFALVGYAAMAVLLLPFLILRIVSPFEA
jgi:hypothetical protein